MNLIKLFKVYSLKTLRENKTLPIICMLAITTSVAVMLAILLVTSSYENRLAYNLSSVNGGDINIQINTDQAADSKVFDSTDLALFSDLEKQNAIQYNLFYRELTNVVYKDKIDNCIVRQLSPAMLDQENSNLDYSLLKEQHMVILTQNVADNLNLSVGDQIYIKLHGNGNDSGQYTVGQIIKPIYGVNVANTDLELSENILGTIYMAAPKTSVYNTAFINVSDPNSTSRIENILQSHFGDQFNVRTKSELWELTKGLITLQLKGLDFIGIVSCIISGIGICFAFIHLIMKRQKDFVIFRVMGMRRGMLSELLLTEILGMGIPASVIGIPLGIVLTHFLLSTNGGFMGNVADAIRQCVFMLIISVLSLIAFSLIPIYISGTIAPNAIFRGGKIKTGSKLKMSWPIFIVILFLSVIFSIYAKSPIGALFIVILFVIGSLVYLIISLLLRIIALFRKGMKNKYYFTFANLEQQHKTTALSSVSLVMGLFLLGLIVYTASGVFPNMNKIDINNEKHPVIMRTSEAYERNAEKILSEMKLPASYSKFHLTPAELTAYNHQSMDDLIKARYYTGGLVPTFQKYCNNLVIYAYDLDTQNEIPVNQGRSFLPSDKGKNRIVISSDFLKSVVDFKVGDNLVLNMNGNPVEFEVIGIQQSESAWGNNCFAYITSDVIPKGSNLSLCYFKRLDGSVDQASAIQFIKSVPDSSIENTDNLSGYVSDFIDRQKSLFLYLTILCIGTGIFLVFLNQSAAFIKRENEMMLFGVCGATKGKLKKIYLLESGICGTLCGLLSVGFCRLVSDFILSSVLQLTYQPNTVLEASMFLASIVIYIGATILPLDQRREQKLYLLLRGSE